MSRHSPSTSSLERMLCHRCVSCPLYQQRAGIDAEPSDYVVALAGNPNTGKSTIFNALTGLRQHTGNWPGKTVVRAEGTMSYHGNRYRLIDLPGTYSLLTATVDEEIARDFILFGHPACTVVVVDAGSLERNLNLVLQVLEVTDKVVIALNLVDEARRQGIEIDHRQLARDLGVPVVPTVAQTSQGLDQLVEAIAGVVAEEIKTRPHRIESDAPFRRAVDELVGLLQSAYPLLPNARWVAMRLLDGDRRVRGALLSGELAALAQSEMPAARLDDGGLSPNTSNAGVTPEQIVARADTLQRALGATFRDQIVEAIYADAERIAQRSVHEIGGRRDLGHALDRVLTSPVTGFPIMGLGLVIVLWVTIAGANYPSQLLSTVLFWLEDQGAALFTALGAPSWLIGLVWHGVYRGLAWVVSVMLPPMAIFFPIFTMLEDLGFLPRVAFNMDRLFHAVGAHGKQALSMSMGFGCNAAGVVATRIIESPRERLIAILTNNFVPCNGRFPTLILLATVFVAAEFPPALGSLVAAGTVFAIVLLGIVVTLIVSAILARTVLKGEPSSFLLELPPYRRPKIVQTLYTSLIDRTLFVLYRAVIMAVPAGGLIWLLSNLWLGNQSLALWIAGGLDPLGRAIGLDGVILLAYVIAIPANEIVVPTILMTYANATMMLEVESLDQLRAIFVGQQWTMLTAMCLMLFSLLHNPCSTTIWTIWTETRSRKWTIFATLMPLLVGLLVTFVFAQGWRLLSKG